MFFTSSTAEFRSTRDSMATTTVYSVYVFYSSTLLRLYIVARTDSISRRTASLLYSLARPAVSPVFLVSRARRCIDKLSLIRVNRAASGVRSN